MSAEIFSNAAQLHEQSHLINRFFMPHLFGAPDAGDSIAMWLTSLAPED